MPKSYKAKVDVSFPRPIRTHTLVNGKEFIQSIGISYKAGDIISDEFLTARDAARASKGELKNLLEAIPATRKKTASKTKAVKEETAA